MGYFKQAMIEDLANREFEYRKGQLLDRIDMLKERLDLITERMPKSERNWRYWDCLNSRLHAYEVRYAIPEEIWTVEAIMECGLEGEGLWTAEDLIVGIRQAEDELKDLVRDYEEELERVAWLDVIPGQMNLMDFPAFRSVRDRA